MYAFKFDLEQKKLIGHLLQGSVMVLLRQKVYVSGGDDANKFAAHLASLCDRDPREAVADLCLKDIADCVLGAHHHWVCYETLLKFLARTVKQMFSKALSIYGLKSIVICIDYMCPSHLNFAHFIGLELSCAVMMNYSNPAHQLKPSRRKQEINKKTN